MKIVFVIISILLITEVHSLFSERQCGKKKGEYTKLGMHGCQAYDEDIYCKLEDGFPATLYFQFKSEINAQNVHKKGYIIYHGPTTEPDTQIADSNACEEHDIKCPVYKDTVSKYRADFRTPFWAPLDTLGTLYWNLTDPHTGNEIICIAFRIIFVQHPRELLEEHPPSWVDVAF